MSTTNVVAQFDALKGLLSQAHSTNCDFCGALIWLSGPQAKDSHPSRLSYSRKNGELHACTTATFCSSECAHAWLGDR